MDEPEGRAGAAVMLPHPRGAVSCLHLPLQGLGWGGLEALKWQIPQRTARL